MGKRQLIKNWRGILCIIFSLIIISGIFFILLRGNSGDSTGREMTGREEDYLLLSDLSPDTLDGGFRYMKDEKRPNPLGVYGDPDHEKTYYIQAGRRRVSTWRSGNN